MPNSEEITVMTEAHGLDKAKGMLIGLAVGDAVGTTLEFRTRGQFQPITDMVGGGPFDLAVGQWTDDTSMALCLAESLIHCQAFDPVDQMNRYCNWKQYGYMSVNGTCFDIGNTVSSALDRYLYTGEPFSGSTDPYSAGNGSLMRLAPIVLAFHDDPELLNYARDSSRTTHGAEEAVDACATFADMLSRALQGQDKASLFTQYSESAKTSSVVALQSGAFLGKSYDELCGSGYVIESLEAALWCFYHSESYEDAILKAANLGDDADTTAVICGQVAGAYYGYSGIPEKWVSRLHWNQTISEKAALLYTSAIN